MKSYALKNIIFFILAVSISVGIVSLHQNSSLSKSISEERHNKLIQINKVFSLQIEKEIEKSFQIIHFLAHTSYPTVALQSGTGEQFFKIVNEVNEGQSPMGILLFDSLGNLSAHEVRPEVRRLVTSRKFPIHVRGQGSIFFSEEFVFYVKPLRLDENGGRAGYLGGVLPRRLISESIEADYLEKTSEFYDWYPKIEMVLRLNQTKIVPFSLSVLDLQFSDEYTIRAVVPIGKKALIYIVSVTALIIGLFAIFFRKSLQRPVYQLIDIVQFVSSETPNAYEGGMPSDPLFLRIANAMLEMHVVRRKAESETREKIIQQKMLELISQIAHDIRSPATALDMIARDLDSLPEDTRTLIRSAVSRIKDIANKLLIRNSRQDLIPRNLALTVANVPADLPASDPMILSDNANLKLQVELLSSFLEVLVSEKRLVFRERIGVYIDFELTKESYGLFAEVDSVEFKRAISNLIDNSVEAIPKKGGSIHIRLFSTQDEVIVEVVDTGRGIAPQILAKLGQPGITHGKKGTESGFGLGISHARQCIEGMGGRLSIKSRPGQGTAVTIFLRRVNPPDWFLPELIVNDHSDIVILDDDISIHKVWERQFISLSAATRNIVVHHASTVKQFLRIHKKLVRKNRLYLVDYELIGEAKTGLDLIQTLNCSHQSILVTSYFEHGCVRARCSTLGIKLLPKGLAWLVPVKVRDQTSQTACLKKASVESSIVLIDDDQLVRRSWVRSARKRKKNILTFSRVQGFYEVSGKLPKTTPIYIDSRLGPEKRGEIEAKAIYDLGFKSIFVVTGYPAEQFNSVYWIKGVLGKLPPWELAH